jgi:hypothetical protein
VPQRSGHAGPMHRKPIRQNVVCRFCGRCASPGRVGRRAVGLAAPVRMLRPPMLLRLGPAPCGCICFANAPIQQAFGLALAMLATGDERWITIRWLPAAFSGRQCRRGCTNVDAMDAAPAEKIARLGRRPLRCRNTCGGRERPLRAGGLSSHRRRFAPRPRPCGARDRFRPARHPARRATRRYGSGRTAETSRSAPD